MHRFLIAFLLLSAFFLSEHAASAQTISVLDHGAKCNGSTDDTVAINAAIAAAGQAIIGGVGEANVIFPSGHYCNVTTLNPLPNNVNLVGEGKFTSILQTTSATDDVVSITGADNLIANLMIISSGPRTSGDFIHIKSGASNAEVRSVELAKSFVGVEIENGVSLVTLRDIHLHMTAPAGTGVLIGRKGAGKGSMAMLIDHLVVTEANSPAAAVALYNCGDLIISNSHLIGAQSGLYIAPATSQVVTSLKVSEVFFDHNDVNLNVVTGGGGFVRSNFDGAWFGTPKNDNVVLDGSNGGIDGITFSDSESYGGKNGILIGSNTRNISWTGGKIAGNIVGVNINQSKASGDVLFVGARIGAVAGFPENTTGVTITGSGSDIAFTGNDLTGNKTILTNSGAGTHLSFTNNVGYSIFTLSTLPACSPSLKGQIFTVTDAASPTYGGPLNGGGSATIPALCNGSVWQSY